MIPSVASATRRISALRLALRLARRETLRRPWRTLLAALLVAIPVAGMVLGAVWFRTEYQTPLEQWQASRGHADLYVIPGISRGIPPGVPVVGDVPAAADVPLSGGGETLEELLPPGSRSISYREEWRLLRTTAGARSEVQVTDLPMVDPLAAPIMHVSAGRAPTQANEVLLTRSVAHDLGVAVGDIVRLERPEGLSWTVVGIGEQRQWWHSRAAVLGPETVFPWREDFTGHAPGNVNLVDLPDPVNIPQLASLSGVQGEMGYSPELEPLIPRVTGWNEYGPYEQQWYRSASDVTEQVAWSWVIGALALAVVGIVIAAAFAAGARRQLTMLGQLAASGASPRTLRRVIFLQGTWSGLLGAVVGFGLAGVTLVVASPHIDGLFERDVDSYTVRVGDLVPIFVLGVVASTVAALVPARTASRIPVLVALAGRRPLHPVPARLTTTGIAMGAAGLGLLGLAAYGADGDGGRTAWEVTAVIGGVATLLGACTFAPGYVSVLEPLAGRLRGSARLAARSLARQRTRTGAVVSAVCATSALAVASSALLLSTVARDDSKPEWMRPDEVHFTAEVLRPAVDGIGEPPRPIEVPDDYVDLVEAALPGSEIHHLRRVGRTGDGREAWWELLAFTPTHVEAEDGPRALYMMDGPGLQSGGPASQSAVVADDELLDLYDFPAEVVSALGEDGIVHLASRYVEGTATVRLVTEGYGQSLDGQPLGGHELVPPFQMKVVASGDLPFGSIPRILMTLERARELGLEVRGTAVVVRAPAPLSDADREALEIISADYRDLSADAEPVDGEMRTVHQEFLYPDLTPNPRLLEGLFSAAALVLSMIVVAVSLALAAAETRDERDVLAIVGTPPSTMRRASGGKAFLLTFLGAVPAVPVGFLPIAVFTAVDADYQPLVFPWRTVALLVVCVPLVAALATTLFSGLALRLRPVRVSSMAFD